MPKYSLKSSLRGLVFLKFVSSSAPYAADLLKFSLPFKLDVWSASTISNELNASEQLAWIFFGNKSMISSEKIVTPLSIEMLRIMRAILNSRSETQR